MRLFLDFTFYKGCYGKQTARATDPHIPMCSLSLYGKNNVSLGTELKLTSFFYIGKLLKITADLHVSQSAIAFRPSSPHPQWLLNVKLVLWESEASTQFGCLSSFFCLFTPCHRSGCRVWVIGEDRTNLLTLEI